MKTVRRIGIAVILVILVVIIIGFFLPRHATVEGRIQINSTKEIAFKQINILKNWEKWSPWYEIDTATIYTYSELEGGKEASYTWKSEHKSVGNGKLTITESIIEDSIEIEMIFEGQGRANCYFNFTDITDGIEVKWTVITNAGFNPVARFFNLFMKKPLGKDIEKGLANLKVLCENYKESYSINIEEFNFVGCKYIGIMDSCSSVEISSKLEQLYGELSKYMQKNKLEYITAPIDITYFYSDEKTIFEAAIPISSNSKVKDEGRVKVKEILPVTVALGHYYGAYNQIYTAYLDIEKWIKENKKNAGTFSWEEYITDPVTETDTSKWYTKIYYVIN